MGFRGDGYAVETWQKTQNLETLVSRFYVQWLRGRHGDSNLLSLEIPVLFVQNAKGAKHILIYRERLDYFLQLKDSDVKELGCSRLLTPPPSIKTPRPPMEYNRLAQEYSRRLSSGEFPTKAALARNLHVSRAWITKVMKIGRVGEMSPLKGSE